MQGAKRARTVPAAAAAAGAASAGDAGGRYAITFGEVAILHVGGAECGGRRRDTGFSFAQLREAQRRAEASGFRAELCELTPPCLRGDPECEAATLLIRGGAALLCGEAAGGRGRARQRRGRESAADDLLEEQRGLPYDRKYFDARSKCTKNKLARHNICFADIPRDIAPSEDYREFTVKAFGGLPRLSELRAALPGLLGAAAAGLSAEGNHYYDPSCGIGFHGDSERKVVICLSLGAPSTLRYHWRAPGSSNPFGPATDLRVEHGDVYIMSEKATGWDWRMRSRYRLVHAAGADKYIVHPRR
eukprot:TRINITY_DN10301_c0_g1_i1.p1 TRINITY_DN10301_c0_g1~~TRINITY_DN10301_c0_g1_i1.p1  ORF type:complete len:327 (+),score=106.21 TRINITY_DN10301_c0_g1_i1:73-981(+)